MGRFVGTVMTWFMPYCLRRQPDGRYAVLNRKGHPVGAVAVGQKPPGPGEFEAQHLVFLPQMSAAVAALMSWYGSEDVEAIYLCGPETGDMLLSAEESADYASRLHLLMQMRAEDESRG